MKSSNKILGLIIAILFAAGIAAGQTKSVAEAEQQISGFSRPEIFSVGYQDRKDLTIAKISIDLRERNKALKKRFKELFIEVSAIYPGIGLDTKPFRTVFCLNTRGKRFHFATDNQLTVSLDNESVDLGIADRSSKLKGRKASETLCWDISREIVEDIGKSASLGIRVGTTTLPIESADAAHFSNFGSLLNTKKGK